MGSLTVLLIATPIFGLSLTPPSASMAPGAVTQAVMAPTAVQSQVEPGLSAALPPLQAGGDMRAHAETMRTRSSISGIHKPLGIATYAAMGVTLVLGVIQYRNLYGFFDDLGETPCVTGHAIFGQGQCSGTPWLHLGTSILTTALYTATFATSVLMPDPGGLDEGDSDFAGNLRLHKLMRWLHFGGMVAQMALGLLIANGESFGLDRANDFGTLQALSTVHMGLGLVTFGAMTGSFLTLM